MSRFTKNRGGGGGRRDAKQMSKKNRFAALDSDILSAYDDEEDSLPPPRRGFSTIQEQIGRVRNLLRNNKESKAAVRQSVISGGKNAEQIFKVKVPRGAAFGERWLLKQLYQQEIPDFKPLMVTTTPKREIEFFLKSKDATDTLQAINRRIVHQKSGERVSFQVIRMPAPWQRLSKTEVDIINAVVDSRYSEPNRALDLSEFAMDPQFKAKDLHMMLNKNNVMMAVIDRIDEKYGNIVALSLKGNRLRFLDYASMLVQVCKFVSVLDISDNMIDNIAQLQKLRGLPVKTIFFEGNPLCEQLTKATDYLNTIHQVFPKVIGLDGQDVPPSSAPQDMDDDDEVVSEPSIKPGFYQTDDVQGLVENFVIEYMKLYDGEAGATTRKSLTEAYDQENSIFTLTIANLADSDRVLYPNDELWSQYRRLSHNIMEQDYWSKHRTSRIFKGSMEIAVQLAKLPITNHYQESFAVDVHLVTPQLLGFTLQGLFEDGTLAKTGSLPTLNYFSRSFYVAPRDGGSVAIISDMLFISAILPERIARYKLLINKALSAAASAASSQQSSGSQQPSEDIRRQMVEQFCKDSGMKPDWSLKCLEDSNWNYEEAGKTFMEMRAQIPAEAFA